MDTHAFPAPLPPIDPGSPWVRSLLAAMSPAEKIGQLLHPSAKPNGSVEEIQASLPPVRVGGLFIFACTADAVLRVARDLQAPGKGVAGELPLVLSSDLESGAGRMIKECTLFPDMMGVAACGDEGLAFEMGRATAREGRAHGLHWNFGPVVDLNYEPRNPITCTRSLGDDPQRAARLARAMILGMQSEGLCATAKHFPGDGWDDRDQHLATTINPLSLGEWERSSGVPFRAALDAGVLSVMIGHIAMPAVDPGDPADPAGPPPAMMSRPITTDFLRGRLGFRNVVISDAIEMNGSVSRARSPYEMVVRNVNAGCDMLLFSSAKRDFGILAEALEKGDLSMERLDEACSRVLALKEALGFAGDPASALPAEKTFTSIPSGGAKRAANAGLAPDEVASFRASAFAIASRAVTAERAEDLPLALEKGSRVLCVHLRSWPEYDVTGFDELLRARGVEVDVRTEADDIYLFRGIDYSKYAAVLLLYVIGPTWGMNTVRPRGSMSRIPWFVCQAHPGCPVVAVSFGTPYLLHDLPWARNYLNAYSPDGFTEEAVLRILLGEAEPEGKCPVDLDRAERLRELLKADVLG